MAKSMTDWSALNRLKVKTVAPPPPVAKSVPAVEDDGAAEVLAYFSRGGCVPGKAVAKKVHQPTEAEALRAECRALTAQVAELTEARKADAARVEKLERESKAAAANAESLAAELKSARDASNGVRAELLRLRIELEDAESRFAAAHSAELDRLRAELAETKQRLAEAAGRSLVSAPSGFLEAFSGELREMTISALKDSLTNAINGNRERRSTVLSAVLEANPASGELAKRRAQLKQIMKDAGYFNDPKALETLGFRLISGHDHWKLEYAGVRMPLAKTPSDHRANLNGAAEMANRCF